MTFVSVRVQLSVFFTQTQYEIAKYLSCHLKNIDFQCFKTSYQMYNLFNLNMDVFCIFLLKTNVSRNNKTEIYSFQTVLIYTYA